MLKYRLINCLLIALLMVPALALAADNDDQSFGNYLRSGSANPLGLRPFGLLDPSRMNFRTSYSMSYATSGGRGLMQGLFMETIGYRLSNPLSLTFNVGVQHTPYSNFGPDGITRSARFVGGAALDWRPSENMFLHFEVANYPRVMTGYDPYWNPYPYTSPFQIQSNQNQPNQELQSK
jgi:hypothetical protein